MLTSKLFGALRKSTKKIGCWFLQAIIISSMVATVQILVPYSVLQATNWTYAKLYLSAFHVSSIFPRKTSNEKHTAMLSVAFDTDPQWVPLLSPYISAKAWASVKWSAKLYRVARANWRMLNWPDDDQLNNDPVNFVHSCKIGNGDAFSKPSFEFTVFAQTWSNTNAGQAFPTHFLPPPNHKPKEKEWLVAHIPVSNVSWPHNFIFQISTGWVDLHKYGASATKY